MAIPGGAKGVAPGSEPRRVFMIASEVAPFAKTGGLGDVLGALPAALARLGRDVTVALPRYRGVAAGALIEHFPVSVGGYTPEVGFFDAPLADWAHAPPVDCPALYDRQTLYGVHNAGDPDNARRLPRLRRRCVRFQQ